MSSSEIKNVLIAGASGSLGSTILTELLASKKFNVFVLSREGSKATFPSEVQVLKSAYTPDALTTLLTSLPSPIDAVVSNLNGKEGITTSQLALIDAAKSAGVKRFLPSEFGIDTSNDEIIEKLPLLRGKKAVIDYLKTKEDDKFNWTALITGLFFDWGVIRGFTQIDVKNKKFLKWDGGSIPFSTTNLHTIGKAVVNLLDSPERLAATANRFVYFSSYTTTQNELFEAVKKSLAEISGTGDGTWTVEDVDSEEAGSKALSAFKNGDFSGVYDLFRVTILGKRHMSDYSKLENNQLFGLERENFDADVKRIVKEMLTAKT